jgi:EDD domain protein, DegV family
MKIAVITDSSAFLPDETKNRDNLFILDVPITIDGETYFEGKNLTNEEFYKKMAASSELPKTSQPSLSELENLLDKLKSENYTHVLGFFLSKGISGFYQNSYYLQSEYDDMKVHFFDTKITSAPLGYMVTTALELIDKGQDFTEISKKIDYIIEKTRTFIIVDDLNHLVKGGRLTNGAALFGSLLNIKPILEFDNNGEIVVFEKIRTSKKAYKRLISIFKELSSQEKCKIFIVYSEDDTRALDIKKSMEKEELGNVNLASFGAIIGTHLGNGAVGFAISPEVD